MTFKLLDGGHISFLRSELINIITELWLLLKVLYNEPAPMFINIKFLDQYQYLGNCPPTPSLTQQQSIDNK